MEQLLTSAEVCAELRISKATLSRLCAAGTLGCHRIGSQLRFRRADLTAYLDSARITPAPKRGRPPRKRQSTGQTGAQPFDLAAYKAANIYIPPHPYFPGMKIVPGVSFSELPGNKKSAHAAGTGAGAGAKKRTTTGNSIQQTAKIVKGVGA